MAIEIVDLPIKNCDIPVRKMLVYQRVTSRVEFQNNFRALSRMDMRWYESKSGNHKLNDFWMLESRLFSFPMVQHVWTHKCWLQKNRHVFCLCPHLGPFFLFVYPFSSQTSTLTSKNPGVSENSQIFPGTLPQGAVVEEVQVVGNRLSFTDFSMRLGQSHWVWGCLGYLTSNHVTFSTKLRWCRYMECIDSLEYIGIYYWSLGNLSWLDLYIRIYTPK